MVTGKNKEQFKDWFLDKEYDFVENQEFWHFGIFYNLPFNMQLGVYLAYYDSLDLLIGIEYQYGFKWTLLEVNEGQDFHCGGFDTRNEAYQEALKQADKLMNSN